MNLLVGAVLVTAMVDVPLFVNAIEVDLERSAVVAGWVLAAMTGFMVLATYGGGRCAQRYGSGCRHSSARPSPRLAFSQWA